MPGCALRAIASVADWTNRMSGSRVLLSGVGTAIEIASHRPSALSSVVASNIPAFTHRRDVRRRHILNVRLAAHEQLAHALAHVVADHVEAGFRELHRERQADVAQPDDANGGRSVLNSGEELCFDCAHRIGG